jgi:hypothetical protein
MAWLVHAEGVKALILFAFISSPDPYAIHCCECNTIAEYGLRGSKEGRTVRYYRKSHGPTKGCFKIDKNRARKRRLTHLSIGCNQQFNLCRFLHGCRPGNPRANNCILFLLQHGFRGARRRKGRQAIHVLIASNIARGLEHGRQQPVSVQKCKGEADSIAAASAH